jgi:uncharacterized protein (DUF2126 family)
MKTPGSRLRPNGFAREMEFRFPLQGELTYDVVTMEFRTALEPWHIPGVHPVSAVSGTRRAEFCATDADGTHRFSFEPLICERLEPINQ